MESAENEKELIEYIQYPDIAKDILAMAALDQIYRKQYLVDRQAGKLPQWNHGMDKNHTKKLKQIVQQIGWPTISAVGKQASFAAWLLVQHADHDLVFQKSCLALMMALRSNEIDPANIAYLTDRILVSEGKSQIYGTQFYYDQSQKLVLHLTEDRPNLNKRRASIGLEAIQEAPNLL
jgi:hypothetical protein